MVHHDGLLLPLAVEAGVGLLVELQRPSEAEPDDDVPTALEVQAVARRGGMRQEEGDGAGVPAVDVVAVLQLHRVISSEPLPDACRLVAEGIEDEDRLSVGRLDDFLQRVELGSVDVVHLLVAVVDGPAGELQELVREGGGIDGGEGFLLACLDELKATMRLFAFDLLGLREEKAGSDGAREEAFGKVVDMVLDLRAKAKAAKDWATSDRIRDDLAAAGFEVKDTKDGVTWRLNR